jgi:hypothetical protein
MGSNVFTDHIGLSSRGLTPWPRATKSCLLLPNALAHTP